MIRSPLIIAITAITACADLASYELNGQCGNHIIEPSFGEACDGDVEELQRCAGPGERHACQYICTRDAICPRDWACGLDGQCRPADTGLTAPRVLDVFPDHGLLAAGHLDGDSALDLARISDRELRVRFGDSDRPLEDTLVVSPIRNGLGAAIADFDGDARDDVILPHLDGLTVLRSRKNRALVPYATPQIFSDEGAHTEWLAVRGDAEHQFHDLLRVINSTGAVELITAGDPLEERFALLNPCTNDPLLGCAQLNLQVLGDLDGDGRDELIAVGGDELHGQMYSASCSQLGDRRRCELIASVTITVPEVISLSYFGTNVIAADVDGNNTLDLIFDLRRSGASPFAVAYNDGAGGFCSKPVASSACHTQDRNVARAADFFGTFDDCGPRVLPYRAVDLDGDGDTDYVAEAIYLNDAGTLTPSNCVVTGASVPRVVVAADLDDDGLPEIVALSNEPELILYVGTADRVYNRRTITFPARALAGTRGDFDGDGLEDVAIAAAHGEEEHGTELWILYGARDLSGLAPVLAGETKLTSSVLTTGQLFGEHGRSLWNESAGGGDLITDLLLSDGTSPEDARLVAFNGRADRALESVFRLRLPEDRTLEPKLIVQGDFRGTASQELLVLLAEEREGTFFAGAMMLEALDVRSTDTFVPIADCPPLISFGRAVAPRVGNGTEKDSLLIFNDTGNGRIRTAKITAEGIVCGTLDHLLQERIEVAIAATPLKQNGVVALIGGFDERGDITNRALVTELSGRVDRAPIPEELADREVYGLAAGGGFENPRLIVLSDLHIDELELIDHRWVFRQTLATFEAPIDERFDLVDPGIFISRAQPIFEDFNEDRLPDLALGAPVALDRLPGEEATVLYLRESDALP